MFTIFLCCVCNFSANVACILANVACIFANVAYIFGLHSISVCIFILYVTFESMLYLHMLTNLLVFRVLFTKKKCGKSMSLKIYVLETRILAFFYFFRCSLRYIGAIYCSLLKKCFRNARIIFKNIVF